MAAKHVKPEEEEEGEEEKCRETFINSYLSSVLSDYTRVIALNYQDLNIICM